jgi:hypothetical protein
VPKTEDGCGVPSAKARVTCGDQLARSGAVICGKGGLLVRDGRAVPLATARYVELNPVRAKLVEHPRQWPWSSAKAHLKGRDDRLVTVAPLLAMVGDWKAFLTSAIPEEELRNLRAHSRTGRPLGSSAFLDRLENLVGRVLNPQKPGPKPKPRKARTRRIAN